MINRIKEFFASMKLSIRIFRFKMNLIKEVAKCMKKTPKMEIEKIESFIKKFVPDVIFKKITSERIEVCDSDHERIATLSKTTLGYWVASEIGGFEGHETLIVFLEHLNKIEKKQREINNVSKK